MTTKKYIDPDKIDFRLPYFTDTYGDALVSLSADALPSRRHRVRMWWKWLDAVIAIIAITFIPKSVLAKKQQ